MQVIFIGGASGVGASCVAIQLAHQWIVVDAGVRVDHKADPLPDLALLEGKDVRAIFVTHAHADHIGALPLLHQAFPTTPIFTSRATALLMEVMLADALKIMTRRAVEEMEIPLYPETLVSSMLTRVRPIPVGESFTLSELPTVTISTSRAGHIAGAMSVGFTASDGAIVVSGDISSTPQRTVQGAVPPAMERCDLLILESTYGARLHPNRQAEELRLAQAVAENFARGGHTLIPCFGLGRGQELLLLLQSAQEKGQVPHFPIYVDGLVRRVCSTYQLLPEALTPTLQRQIRKGYLPFAGRNVTFVRDERERLRILAGPPACILSSSGMLTGGPSAWYAARLAGQPNASILITGYQDEESPGKKLLDLAEQRRDTLELNGQTVQVACNVAKYSLSAHADGSELAAYAAALKPRQVALVHGDADARAALRALIAETDVILPQNGASLDIGKQPLTRGKPVRKQQVAALTTLPANIGNGKAFEAEDIDLLWDAICQVSTMRIVTARELAAVWYGEATEETTAQIVDILSTDIDQRYFVRQSALEEAYRVRGQQEDEPEDIFSELVGQLLFLQVRPDISKVVFCKAIEPGATIRVQFPKGAAFERTRYPYSAILDLIGPAPQEMLDGSQTIGAELAELSRQARRIRRKLSAQELARQCQEEATYTLSELCTLAGLSPNTLEERLAVAKLLFLNPNLFLQRSTLLEEDGQARYGLAPEWQEALEEPETSEAPDSEWLQSVIETHLGHAPDLYRRGINPETGEITLYFYFPAFAWEHYAQELAALADETGVAVTLNPHPHQGALAEKAVACLPEGVKALGGPSFYFDRSLLVQECSGEATPEAIEQANTAFYEQTRWHLELHLPSKQPVIPVAPVVVSVSTHIATSSKNNGKAVNPTEALRIARMSLRDVPDLMKIGTEDGTRTLLFRFSFPEIAPKRYADRLTAIAEQTGWNIRIHGGVHQQALIEAAQRALPAGLFSAATPSIRQSNHEVGVTALGEATEDALEQARVRFQEETGWSLRIEIKTRTW